MAYTAAQRLRISAKNVADRITDAGVQIIDVGTGRSVKIVELMVGNDASVECTALGRALTNKTSAAEAKYIVAVERFIDSYRNLLSILQRHAQPQQEVMCFGIVVCLGSQKFKRIAAKL